MNSVLEGMCINQNYSELRKTTKNSYGTAMINLAKLGNALIIWYFFNVSRTGSQKNLFKHLYLSFYSLFLLIVLQYLGQMTDFFNFNFW